MGQDVSAEVAGLISGAKVFGSSDNIRHGKYQFLIKKVFSEMVEIDEGQHKFAFWELTPLTSENNPQVEGDHVDYPGTAGPLKDDGTKPNLVGSSCALKVDFDGPGGRSAGGNIKSAILALFNKYDGEVPDAEINRTWLDLSRRKPCKKGDVIGFDAATNQPVIATEDKQANPACGMIINCSTGVKRKKKPNEKGAYVTKLIWACASPIGTGLNSPELVAKRRAEIEATQADDDDEETSTASNSSSAAAAVNGAHNGQQVAPQPPAPPAPSAPAAPFVPPAPWTKHTTAPWGATPESQWYWHPQTNAVKSLAQLKAGL